MLQVTEKLIPHHQACTDESAANDVAEPMDTGNESANNHKYSKCANSHGNTLSQQCISDVPTQYSSDNKDNSTYTNNKYNYKEQRKNTFPTPKATKFSDFTGHSNIDYKKLEKDALRRKIELSKKEHIESG